MPHRAIRLGSAWIALACVSAHAQDTPSIPPIPTAASPGEPVDNNDTSSPVLRGLGTFLPVGPAGPSNRMAPPGDPPRRGRPRPGGIFDPGASGPGIRRSRNEPFLDGALDPESGWPFVFLDHFAPKPERVANFWLVDTRECPQVMGTDPWPHLRIRHFNAEGNLVRVDPAAMLSQTVGRPVLVQVQGNLTTPDEALGGLLWTHAWLERDGGILPGTVIIAFDWPSQRIYKNPARDVNEKGRRAYVAAYHLARFLQAFPAESQVCLLGQSYGGRVVPSALHLLGGGALNSQDRDPYVALPGTRPDLHLRGVILGGASDHDWLDPGERLDHALMGCEAFLNLYNSRDEALRFYPFLKRSGRRHALGKLGLKPNDFESLGPLAARYEEHDLNPLLGSEHTLLDAMANRQISRWIAPYTWAPDPGPLPQRAHTSPARNRRRDSSLGIFR